MVRTTILAFLTLVSLLPPGYCACRLTAAVTESHENCTCDDEGDVPGESDDHDECGCPEIRPDGIVPNQAAWSVAPEQASPTIRAEVPNAVFPSLSLSTSDNFRLPVDQPLYLTLRALLL